MGVMKFQNYLPNSFSNRVSAEWDAFFNLKPTERKWYIPLLAALCVGVPLFIGYAFSHLTEGLLACLAGLVILYLPMQGSFSNRVMRMSIYSVGFVVSFSIGICFSFHPWISVVVFGFFSMLVHGIALYFQLKPPRSFFFIMLCAMASSLPNQPALIGEKIGIVSLGALFATLVALVFSYVSTRKTQSVSEKPILNFTWIGQGREAVYLGIFMAVTLWIGIEFKFPNPYWVPISCLAVLQGVNLHHVWRRAIHRIFGTFIGLGLCWLILVWNPSTLFLCCIIVLLQFTIEFFIVRNYGLAVLFITPMTFLLAETANPVIYHPTELIAARFNEIALGSLIGAFAGWLIYRKKSI